MVCELSAVHNGSVMSYHVACGVFLAQLEIGCALRAPFALGLVNPCARENNICGVNGDVAAFAAHVEQRMPP